MIMNKNIHSDSYVWDGIIDPLFKERKIWEEMEIDTAKNDGQSKIENILNIDPDYLDSFEKWILENHLDIKK